MLNWSFISMLRPHSELLNLVDKTGDVMEQEVSMLAGLAKGSLNQIAEEIGTRIVIF